MHVKSPIPRKKARIEIIPLIDIMFFLLASFMMVSLSQVHMKGIKVNLPSGVSGETQTKREYLSVSVDKNGHYFFDKEEMSCDEQLLNLLKMAHQSAPDAKVFVRGDKDSVHLNVAHALDIIRSAGYYKISFEIKSESLKGVPGGRHRDFGYGRNAHTNPNRSQVANLSATAAMVFLDCAWCGFSNPSDSGCGISTARSSCGRTATSTAAGSGSGACPA